MRGRSQNQGGGLRRYLSSGLNAVGRKKNRNSGWEKAATEVPKKSAARKKEKRRQKKIRCGICAELQIVAEKRDA